MTSNKKQGVIFLKDWRPLIESLSESDQLYFWGLFVRYDVEDLPKCENQIVYPIWIFIESQLLKMDKKYNDTVVTRNQINGSKGGRPKKDETQENPKNPVGYSETQKTLKDNNKENNKENENIKKNNIDERKLKFAETLKPFIETYGKDMVKDFYLYWTEPNKSNTKFRQEFQRTWSAERRLIMWNKNNFGNKNKGGNDQQQTRPSVPIG